MNADMYLAILFGALPDWVKGLQGDLGVLAAIVVSIGVLVGGAMKLRTFLLREIRELIQEELEPIKHEIRPNGGTSMKDQVTALGRRFDDFAEDTLSDRGALWKALFEAKIHHENQAQRNHEDDVDANTARSKQRLRDEDQ